MERQEVYKCIDGERDYQDVTWMPLREESGVSESDVSIAEWINYMEFHLSKAKEASYHLKPNDALAEIRKITALGVKAMEVHGCPIREKRLINGRY